MGSVKPSRGLLYVVCRTRPHGTLAAVSENFLNMQATRQGLSVPPGSAERFHQPINTKGNPFAKLCVNTAPKGSRVVDSLHSV